MRIITRGTLFIRSLLLAFVLLTAWIVFLAQAHADWKVDLSRRSQQTRTQDLREPASSSAEQPITLDPPKSGFFQSLFESSQVAGEIVILNTEKGFIPSTVRVKKGLAYQIHVVNVNEKEKN